MTKALNVIVIDDDEDIRNLSAMSLRNVGGYNVRTAERGQGGIELALAQVPDIILLDVMMPGMGGPEVLAQLREHPELGGCTVAFMTAKAQPQEISDLLDLGAADVITKPFDIMALPERVHAIWLEAQK